LNSERSIKQIQKKVTELAKNKQATAEDRKRREQQAKQIAELKEALLADQTRQIEKQKKEPALAKPAEAQDQ
jgi:hypothetical protein